MRMKYIDKIHDVKRVKPATHPALLVDCLLQSMMYSLLMCVMFNGSLGYMTTWQISNSLEAIGELCSFSKTFCVKKRQFNCGKEYYSQFICLESILNSFVVKLQDYENDDELWEGIVI